MFLFCCERCAKKAKANNPLFDIGMEAHFIDKGDTAECDICGEVTKLLWCEDPEEDDSTERV